MSFKEKGLITFKTVDGNSIGEVYFGSDNGNFYGYTIEGNEQFGFPFSTGANVRSSPAVRDVDLDGVKEIVFGSNDGNLYIINAFGMQELSYWQSGMIVGSPALIDLDLNGDFEIVFTTQEGNSGKVYAITEDGEDMNGFPVNIDEKMVDSLVTFSKSLVTIFCRNSFASTPVTCIKPRSSRVMTSFFSIFANFISIIY